MTYAEFTALIRLNTHTDTVTFPDADLVLYANAVLPEIIQKVNNEVDEDIMGMIATTDLVADQREYSFPVEMFNKMKMIQAKFSDDSDYIPLIEFDAQNNQRPLSEEEILNRFSNDAGRAKFDIFRGSLWIYSGEIINIEDGIELYFLGDIPKLTTGDLASTTDMSIDPSDTTRGLPKSLHEIWARRVQIEWKANREKPIPLTERELSYKNDFQEAIDSMKNLNLTRAFETGVPSDQYNYDNGFNL